MRLTDASPRVKARFAGLLYLIGILSGAFNQAFVRGTLIVNGDAGATTETILAHETLFRFGFTAGVIVTLCNVPLAVIFYDLFKVVDRTIARLVASFLIAGTAIEALNLVHQYVPLTLAAESGALGALSADQLAAVSYVLLKLHDVGFLISLMYYGLFDFPIGYLVIKSRFLPPILGILMLIAGVCYLTTSLTSFLAPAVASALLPYILLPCLIGEASLCLWLLIMGVDPDKWSAAVEARAS